MLYKLPVDISTFSQLRKHNYLYVDKTEHMHRMITQGRRYFLSRPRRFGKSLLISTLKEILQGRRELFKGLWIDSSDYGWQEYGVINLDFSKVSVGSVELFSQKLYEMLMKIAQGYQLNIDNNIQLISTLLEEIVIALYKRFGRVAILIDEYDYPVLKTLHDPELAKKMRDQLQHFFTIIKALDEQIKFVFITGVSSFAKAGLFSGINNLRIITLDDRYAALCGYTESEVDHYFLPYIAEWAEKENISYQDLRSEIKKWYNGYSFGDSIPKVYNPFSLMNALEIKKFKNFWFQSGTPEFLVEILKKEYKSFDPERLVTSEDTLGIFDVGAIPLISLMFQTGYLTIVSYDSDIDLYTLDYPNLEVKRSFQKYLLEVFARIDAEVALSLSKELRIAFEKQDLELAIALMEQLFAHVPYQLHSKEEKFYHALVMMICVGAGIKAQAEYSTSHGRIDLVMEFSNILYIVEIKFNQSPEMGLDQIKERRYYERFICQNKQIVLLGLSFKREPHNFTISYAAENL